MQRFLLSILTLLTVMSASAMDTATQVFDPSFRSLKVQKGDAFLDIPVITLNSDETIVISFDQLADDRSYLRYRLIHCNADWQPSSLLDSEYVDGFNLAEVDDFGYSSNTFIHYVNYRIVIPSPEMRPLLSGNYLLQVFPEDNEEDVVLQARFSVSESYVRILGDVTSNTDRGFNDIWQQLSLKLLLPEGNDVRNPFTDLIVTVEQNGSPCNAVTLSHPQRVAGKEVIYEHLPQLVFPAGNEWRRFETVRADYPGLGVDSVRYINNVYHSFLTPVGKRVAGQYQLDRTQFGRFIIREYNSSDSDLGADYVTVHFTLPADPFTDADVYVDGEMTGHRLSDRYKMNYDDNLRAYTLQLPLKQGSYNYRYVAVPKGLKGAVGNPSPIEGDFYETSNEYDVKVYLRVPGSRADRLIGHAIVYSPI